MSLDGPKSTKELELLGSHICVGNSETNTNLYGSTNAKQYDNTK